MKAADNITIREMTDDVLDEVMAIEKMSFPSPWCKDHFQAELKSAFSFPLVALDFDGKVVGYICPMLVIDEGHILNVAVHPDFRGSGLGSLLVTKVLDACRSQGAEFVGLEVRTSNSVAVSLYRKLGFAITGCRKKYYENGEDAFIMEYIFDNNEGFDDAV